MNTKILKIMMCCVLMNGFVVAADEAKAAEGASLELDRVELELGLLRCITDFLQHASRCLHSRSFASTFSLYFEDDFHTKAFRLVDFYRKNKSSLDYLYTPELVEIFNKIDREPAYSLSSVATKAVVLCSALNVKNVCSAVIVEEDVFRRFVWAILQRASEGIEYFLTWKEFATLLSIDAEAEVLAPSLIDFSVEKLLSMPDVRDLDHATLVEMYRNDSFVFAKKPRAFFGFRDSYERVSCERLLIERIKMFLDEAALLLEGPDVPFHSLRTGDLLKSAHQLVYFYKRNQHYIACYGLEYKKKMNDIDELFHFSVDRELFPFMDERDFKNIIGAAVLSLTIPVYCIENVLDQNTLKDRAESILQKLFLKIKDVFTWEQLTTLLSADAEHEALALCLMRSYVTGFDDTAILDSHHEGGGAAAGVVMSLYNDSEFYSAVLLAFRGVPVKFERLTPRQRTILPNCLVSLFKESLCRLLSDLLDGLESRQRNQDSFNSRLDEVFFLCKKNTLCLNYLYRPEHLQILKDVDGGYPFGASAASLPLEESLKPIIKWAVLSLTIKGNNYDEDVCNVKRHALHVLPPLLSRIEGFPWEQLKTLLAIDAKGDVA